MDRFPRSIIEFVEVFPDEAACVEYLTKKRWPDGFVCPACGSVASWYLEKRRLWQCTDCGRQTSLTAGTIMANTKLPLKTWFWAAYMMATHSNGMSAKQIQFQFDVQYRTAWLIESKMRRAMVAPDRTRLTGVVEIDQTEIPFREKDPPLGVGGRMGMLTVIGAVEVIDKTTGVPPRWRLGQVPLDTTTGRVRLQILPANTWPEIVAFVLDNVEPGTVVMTDGHASYNHLQMFGYRHDPHTVGLMAAHLVLPWIHRVFALLKRWGMGVYHGLRRAHVQTYLDEFVFRFNRRRGRRAAFERILGITMRTAPETYNAMTGRGAAVRQQAKLRRQASLHRGAGI